MNKGVDNMQGRVYDPLMTSSKGPADMNTAETAVPIYSSDCVKCRYARPGDNRTHVDHAHEAAVVDESQTS